MIAPLTPSALALLVNESRARCLELSEDFYCRLWLPPPKQREVTALWREFSSTVCTDDHIALSIRTRYFRKILASFFKGNGGSFLNVASGLASYAFDLPLAVACYELDSSDIIEFKKARAEVLAAAGDLPARHIASITYDLTHSSVEELGKLVATSPGPRVILLEGISYYLPSARWVELLSELRRSCTADDIVCFDFWRPPDGEGVTLTRYKAFLSRHDCFPEDGFNFLDLQSTQVWNGWSPVEVTNVFEQHKLIGREWDRNSEPLFFVEHYCVLQRER